MLELQYTFFHSCCSFGNMVHKRTNGYASTVFLKSTGLSMYNMEAEKERVNLNTMK